MLNIIYFSTITSYLLSIFMNNDFFSHLTSILCFLSVLTSIFFVKRHVFIIGLFFLVGSVVIQKQSGGDLISFIFSFGEMMQVITLLTLIPIISFPIQIGNYTNNIEHILRQKQYGASRLFILLSSISYILSSFINLAALNITHTAVQSTFNQIRFGYKEKFLCTSLTFGFAMTVLWSPVTPIVGIVLGLTHVDFISVLIYLLPISLFALLCCWGYYYLLNKFYLASYEITYLEQITNHNDINNKKLIHIFIAIFVLILSVQAISSIVDLPHIILISIMIFPISYIWAVLIKKRRSYRTLFKSYFHSYSTKFRSQFYIFLTSGAFITNFRGSNFETILNENFHLAHMELGSELTLFLLTLIPMFLSFIGLHPAISIALLYNALAINLTSFSAELMTVVLLGSAIPAFLLGPFNSTLNLMALLIKQPVHKLVFWNIPYALLFLIILSISIKMLFAT